MKDNYLTVCEKALQDKTVLINVRDSNYPDFDLEGSRNIDEIEQACQETELPLVVIFRDGIKVGSILVLCGYGDESICDHSDNQYMNDLMVDIL